MIEEIEKIKQDPSETNKELVRRTLAGDNEAFADLVKSYYRAYYVMAMSYVHNHEKAEDIVQETLIEIHRDLGKLREPKKYGSWSYSIIRNNCYREKTKMINEPTVMSNLDVSDLQRVYNIRASESIDNSFELRAQHDEIVKAIYRLPHKYKEISMLYFCGELNYKQISELVPVSAHTAEMRIYRARKMLQELLKELHG